MTSPAVRLWYALLVSFLACVAVAVSAVVLTQANAAEQQRQSDRRWCELMVALDDAYRSNPPTTPAGQDIAAKVHDMRGSLGCDDKED